VVFSAVHSVIIHEVPSETLEEGIGPIRENPDKAILRSPQETIIAAALKRTQVRCSGVVRLRDLDCDSRSKSRRAGWPRGE